MMGSMPAASSRTVETTRVVVDHRTLIRVERGPLRTIRDDEVLLRPAMIGICGTDLFKIRNRTVDDGTVLGHEVVGRVEAIGRRVTRLRLGQRVVVSHHVSCGVCRLCRVGNEPLCPSFRENLLEPGGFSDRLIVRSRAVTEATYPFEESVADEAAVFLEPAACVIRGVRRSGLLSNPAPTAAILGAGSMGLLHLLVLKALEPSARVILIDPLPDRRDIGLRLGAESAIAPGSSAVEARVPELVDVVFDTVGGAEALRHSLSRLRPGGTVVLFAHAAEGEPADFPLNDLFKSERRLVSTYSSSLENQREAYRLLIDGRLDPSPLVTHHLPLSRFSQALELLDRYEALKVVFIPEEVSS